MLDGDEGRHAARVRRIGAGELVSITDGRGGVATCRVTAVAGALLALAVQSRSFTPPPAPRLVVVQALAKGDRGERAVELMTELGVDEIVPWSALRSVAQWRGERGERSRERWAATALAAAKQARRSWLPAVASSADSAAVALLLRSASAALVLDHLAEKSWSSVKLPADGDVVVVVGPEGGIDADELALFSAAGAIAGRLGPTVLRTSTAGAAALAVLSARLGRWP